MRALPINRFKQMKREIDISRNVFDVNQFSNGWEILGDGWQ
jgi:hypothetical protein